MVECNPSGAQVALRWPVAKRPCRRSEVITLPRRHALDDWPRSGPRQASALHSSPSFCPTFCGQITALRHCRLRRGNPSRASTASAGLPWAANPSAASALTRQVAPRLPAHSGQQHDPARFPQKNCAELWGTLRPYRPNSLLTVTPDGDCGRSSCWSQIGLAGEPRSAASRRPACSGRRSQAGTTWHHRQSRSAKWLLPPPVTAGGRHGTEWPKPRLATKPRRQT
jgi:hypothetical protein